MTPALHNQLRRLNRVLACMNLAVASVLWLEFATWYVAHEWIEVIAPLLVTLFAAVHIFAFRKIFLRGPVRRAIP